MYSSSKFETVNAIWVNPFVDNCVLLVVGISDNNSIKLPSSSYILSLSSRKGVLSKKVTIIK